MYDMKLIRYQTTRTPKEDVDATDQRGHVGSGGLR